MISSAPERPQELQPLLQIDAIRLLDGTRLPLVHPERPHETWECIAGKVFVRRPGARVFEPMSRASWPDALSLDLLDPAVFPTVDRRIVEAAAPRFAAEHLVWSLTCWRPISPLNYAHDVKVWMLAPPLHPDLREIGWYGVERANKPWKAGDAGRWYSDIHYPDCPELASIPFAPENLGRVRAALLRLFYPAVPEHQQALLALRAADAELR